jgi:DNA-binding ferritin-like protein
MTKHEFMKQAEEFLNNVRNTTGRLAEVALQNGLSPMMTTALAAEVEAQVLQYTDSTGMDAESARTSLIDQYKQELPMIGELLASAKGANRNPLESFEEEEVKEGPSDQMAEVTDLLARLQKPVKE